MTGKSIPTVVIPSQPAHFFWTSPGSQPREDGRSKFGFVVYPTNRPTVRYDQGCKPARSQTSNNTSSSSLIVNTKGVFQFCSIESVLLIRVQSQNGLYWLVPFLARPWRTTGAARPCDLVAKRRFSKMNKKGTVGELGFWCIYIRHLLRLH